MSSNNNDILRITLLDSSYNKFFESQVPANDKKKVKSLLLVVKDKGVDIPIPKDKDVDWW